MPILSQNVVFYTTIHEHLGMSKVSARWVPRNLNMQDRQQKVESSQELLDVYNANPEDYHTRLVTEKEPMQWKHPQAGSPPFKKFRTQPSAGKVMASVFRLQRDYIHVDR